MKAAASSGMMPEGTNISPDMLKVCPPLRCTVARTAPSSRGCLICRNPLGCTNAYENWCSAICSADLGMSHQRSTAARHHDSRTVRAVRVSDDAQHERGGHAAHASDEQLDDGAAGRGCRGRGAGRCQTWRPMLKDPDAIKSMMSMMRNMSEDDLTSMMKMQRPGTTDAQARQCASTLPCAPHLR